jgi:hypothetical protein
MYLALLSLGDFKRRFTNDQKLLFLVNSYETTTPGCLQRTNMIAHTIQ